MFRNTYHKELESLRKKAGYNQAGAALAVGLPRRRWNDLEKGRHGPSDEESALVESLLGPVWGAPRPPRVNKLMRDAGLLALPATSIFQLKPDRSARLRFLAARRDCAAGVKSLVRTIAAREDFDIVDYFCHQLCLDSTDEVMFVLHLLQQGARPALVAPGLLPPTPCPMVNPSDREAVAHRLQHCLILYGAFHFFQVSFSTPRVYTVDVLRWKDGWSALEIDGLGHDRQRDEARTEALRLPVVRLHGHQVRQLDFKAA